MSSSLAELLRELYPRVLSKVIAKTRVLPDAEDAVQDAIERALSTWPGDGTPDSPEAWLITVATNAFRDRLRRRKREDLRENALEVLAEMSPWARIGLSEPEFARGWIDELLRLLFACCHPALDEGESAALALATVVGMSTKEIAAAFVVAPRTMEQRLNRARQRLRARGDYEGTEPDHSADRAPAVQRVIHLLFNEGYWSTDDDAPIRADLCRLAIGLAQSLVDALSSPEASGLLALLVLHDARRSARLDTEGQPVALPEQDRSRWDQAAIIYATELLDRALAEEKPGPFQIEAAISAVHSRARSAGETEWAEIADLYAILEGHRSTPAVRVNRAFAVARSRGPAAGLELITDITSYPYVHLVRGTLLGELGRVQEAKEELLLAESHARNAHERDQIKAKIAAL